MAIASGGRTIFQRQSVSAHQRCPVASSDSVLKRSIKHDELGDQQRGKPMRRANGMRRGRSLASNVSEREMGNPEGTRRESRRAEKEQAAQASEG